MERAELLKKYPWMGITTKLEDYLEPGYYDRILREYVFAGKYDLEFLKDAAVRLKGDVKALELGPGTGRATDAFLRASGKVKQLTLVDLSQRMLESCRARFTNRGFISYVNSDSIDFLLADDGTYDFAYSLWSFSHSVHQNLQRLGLSDGRAKVRRAINKLLTENLTPGGSFFLIHFDSLSDEQRISIRQRSRDITIFENLEVQSPSKRLMDDLLQELKASGKVSFECRHYVGAPIRFPTPDTALEYYLNFHMELHFNESPKLPEIVEELEADIRKYQAEDGSVSIKPGCFIYSITRI